MFAFFEYEKGFSILESAIVFIIPNFKRGSLFLFLIKQVNYLKQTICEKIKF